MNRIPAVKKKGSLLEVGSCRVLDIGYPHYAECLCSGPNTCRHALPFGYGFLCRHPKVLKILENKTPHEPRGIAA